MNIRAYFKKSFQSGIIFLMVFSPEIYAANENSLVNVTSSSSAASFSFETDSVEPILRYHEVVHMIANRDEQPMMQVYGSGLVKVHHPVYKKNAGDYEMQLSQQELVAILESLAGDGLMDLNVEKVKNKKQKVDKELRKQGDLFYISDSVTTHIDIKLKHYKPANKKLKVKDYKKSIRVKDIEHDVKRYKSIEEIQKTSKSITLLKKIMKNDKLKRK